MTDEHNRLTRRTVLKTTGGLAGVSLFAGAGAAVDTTGATVDDALDTTSDSLQEALIVFQNTADIGQLDSLSLAEGYLGFDAIPVGYALLTGSQIETVAGWDTVRYVEANRELDYHNADAREVTGTNSVAAEMGYTGETVSAAVIDSGVGGLHPDLADSVERNYQWAGNPLGGPTLWAPVGPVDSDDIGHGSHVSGSIAGDGEQSADDDRGMAPDASLTVYSSGAAVSILKAAAAFDHLLANHADDVDLVNNSYGAASADDYNPDGTLQQATWESFQNDVLPVISAGNSGSGYDTLNDYAKAPHVLCVAATDDAKRVTDFSSRGRPASVDPNYDRERALSNLKEYYSTGSVSGPVGLYRTGVGAPGNSINSTMSPDDPLQATAPDSNIWYAAISGTSMSSPVTAGIAALVIDAARQNGHGTPSATELLNTLEATAYEAHSSYEPASMGAGFVDAAAAVERAENGNFASFSDVDITSP